MRSSWLLHAAFVGVAAGMFSGCPDQCVDPFSYTVDEPSLGTREVNLTWLQTGAQTKLVVTATALDSVTPEGCDPYVDVEYRLVSGDGIIDQSFSTQEQIRPDGSFFDDTLVFALDAERTLEAGVAPDLPDLIDREPRVYAYLGRTDSGYGDGVIRVSTPSGSDDVALATLSAASTP